MSVTKAIDAGISCTKCGTRGFMRCKCWVNCFCGWHYEAGSQCRNPDHYKRKRTTKRKVK